MPVQREAAVVPHSDVKRKIPAGMSWHGCDSVVEREQGQATSPTQREGMVWHKAARPRHRFENPRKDRPLKGPANQAADESEDLEGGYGQQTPVNPYSVSLLTAV